MIGLPTSLVVVLAAVLVQVADGRKNYEARVENLQPTLLDRDIEARSSSDKHKARKLGPNGEVSPDKSDVYVTVDHHYVRKRVMEHGFWSTVFYIIGRGFRVAGHGFYEMFWTPISVLLTCFYGTLKMFGKLQ